MDVFWSIFAFPIGLTLSFGPIIIAWLLMELRQPKAAPKKIRK